MITVCISNVDCNPGCYLVSTCIVVSLLMIGKFPFAIIMFRTRVSDDCCSGWGWTCAEDCRVSAFTTLAVVALARAWDASCWSDCFLETAGGAAHDQTHTHMIQVKQLMAKDFMQPFFWLFMCIMIQLQSVSLASI